jgi:hypothetical protein
MSKPNDRSELRPLEIAARGVQEWRRPRTYGSVTASDGTRWTRLAPREQLEAAGLEGDGRLAVQPVDAGEVD